MATTTGNAGELNITAVAAGSKGPALPIQRNTTNTNLVKVGTVVKANGSGSQDTLNATPPILYGLAEKAFQANNPLNTNLSQGLEVSFKQNSITSGQKTSNTRS